HVAHIEQSNEIGVVHQALDLSLALDARNEVLVVQMLGQNNFDGDPLGVICIPSPKHLAHAADREAFAEVVGTKRQVKGRRRGHVS
ncbi:MAG: hypothetical protein AAF658_08855, partial [Myxococcota bacterium]